jgi:superfamily II DNA or RNA helicase
MPKYPDIKSKDFYEKINKIYSNFKVKNNKKTINDICNPKEFKLQLPQEFLSEFINPQTPYKGVLIYHRIGAGKTCTAVRIAEKWKNYKRIIVVLPASLKGNFRSELRSQCAENNYLKDSERKQLTKLHPSDNEYKEIIKRSDERIDKYYEIFSYNKFVELVKNNELNLKNALLIIDEIQNMVSEGGSFYEILYNAIKKAPKDLRIVLLSATPMFDKPNEIALTMNLLRLPTEIPVGKEFDKKFLEINLKKTGYSYSVKNIDIFKERVKGFISFFRGAPPFVFPEMKIKYVKCEMGNFQYSSYKQVLGKEQTLETGTNIKRMIKSLNVSDLPNNFYIGTRMISNIVFPNKKINDEGFDSLTNKNIIKNLEIYSCKFYEIMKKINGSTGKIFVYSSFKEYGGIKSFTRILDAFGYKDYSKFGEGKKRYSVWSGEESVAMKDEIRAVYNMKSNLKGNHLKIICGSPSIKEGVSLTAVRQVHILEPYWNKSRLEQVIGRASRFCSHKDLEEEKRNVKVYIYVAISPNENEKTIDEFIHNLSNEKEKIIKIFEKAIKEVAIDCNLNKKANVYEGEEDIKCDTK